MDSPIMIMAAMEDVELDILKDKLDFIKTEKENIFTFYSGNIYSKKVILCNTNVGIINAASATTIGILKYSPQCIITQGIAGAYGFDVHKNDIVIATEIINTSSLITPVKSIGHGSESLEWKLINHRDDSDKLILGITDEKLLMHAKNIEKEYNHGKVHYGRISSSDAWNREADRILYFANNYDFLCEEMEGASVYQVAQNYNVPVISFRTISNNEILREEYDRKTGRYVQEFTLKFIESF